MSLPKPQGWKHRKKDAAYSPEFTVGIEELIDQSCRHFWLSTLDDVKNKITKFLLNIWY